MKINKQNGMTWDRTYIYSNTIVHHFRAPIILTPGHPTRWASCQILTPGRPAPGSFDTRMPDTSGVLSYLTPGHPTRQRMFTCGNSFSPHHMVWPFAFVWLLHALPPINISQKDANSWEIPLLASSPLPGTRRRVQELSFI